MPIYDARDVGFDFTKSGFNSLKDLSPYRPAGTRQSMDLPPDSVVAVVYMVNLWGMNNPLASASTLANLLLNVQFVVFLGQLL